VLKSYNFLFYVVKQIDEEDDDAPKFGDIFGYSEKPRHAGQGAWRMLKSVGTGVAAGAATLVAAPIAGARENGVKGFAAGLGLGVVGAVVLPVSSHVPFFFNVYCWFNFFFFSNLKNNHTYFK
jgi:hypothetical protein